MGEGGRPPRRWYQQHALPFLGSPPEENRNERNCPHDHDDDNWYDQISALRGAFGRHRDRAESV